jgi:hypothetical protein
MDQINQISPSDLALISNAQAAMQDGRLLHQFASNHLTQTYGIGMKDQVNLKTGIITRFVEAIPDHNES